MKDRNAMPRPAPKANIYVNTKPFWLAVSQQKLKLQFCQDTLRFQHYPRPVSIYSGGNRLEWREVSGNGVIYADTTLRVGKPLEQRLPLRIVIVELTEKVRILGNLLGEMPKKPLIGHAVCLAWDLMDDDAFYPAFVLDNA